MRTVATAPGRFWPGILLLGSAAFGFSLVPLGRHLAEAVADAPVALVAQEPLELAAVAATASAPAGDQSLRSAGPLAQVSTGETPVVGPDGPGREAPAAGSLRADLEVRRGDTVLGLLGRAGVAATEAHAAVGTLRELADLRQLRAGQKLALELEAEDDGAVRRLTRLIWPVAAARELHLVRDEKGHFAARNVELPLQRELVRFGGAIAGSLYRSAQRSGIPARSLPQLVALLSWDLDLQREVHPGDRFEAVLERRVTEDGEVAEWGDMQLLAFNGRGRRLEAYRFAAGSGRAEFYDRRGRALRKWLLRTPVDGARLSSSFGVRRHPVLGYTRMHKGIDFAAPTGTPILAAAAGLVEFAGRNRGYGRYVRIRHNAEYSTLYAHLSKFAPGLKPGRKLEQGAVIGAVGASGLATGPHLHYEVLRRGEQVDPLRLKATYAEELRGEELRRFEAWRDRIDALREPPGGEALVAQRADG